MKAPQVSRRFFNVLFALRLWSLFVGFWRLYERVVPASRHIMLDGIDGGPHRPYLTRRHVIPRNPWFNIYLHRFVHGDDDRAKHDHPWPSASLLLEGRYCEHTTEFLAEIVEPAHPREQSIWTHRLYDLLQPLDGRRYVNGSCDKNEGRFPGFHAFDYTQHFGAGDFRKLKPGHTHMISLYGNNDEPCLTLFFTGSIVQRWGFDCGGKIGRRDFEAYTAPHPTKPNATVGCD